MKKKISRWPPSLIDLTNAQHSTPLRGLCVRAVRFEAHSIAQHAQLACCAVCAVEFGGGKHPNDGTTNR
jgi:hypothetical protein